MHITEVQEDAAPGERFPIDRFLSTFLATLAIIQQSRCVIEGFACAHLLDAYLPQIMSGTFDPTLTTTALLPQQLGLVWHPHLNADPEGPTLIVPAASQPNSAHSRTFLCLLQHAKLPIVHALGNDPQ